MFNDCLKIKGIFEMNVYEVIGKEYYLIRTYRDNNVVVTLGKMQVAKLLANDGINKYISSIAFGTNPTAATVADTTIQNMYIKNVDGFEYPSSTSVKFNWSLGLLENNGVTIYEYGLVCQDGTLFSRKVVGEINKASDVVINGSWTIIIV